MSNTSLEISPMTTIAIFPDESSIADLCSNGSNDIDSSTLRDRIVTQVISAILMFGLGCSTEVKLMWNYMKQPKQFATALFLQLLIMPWLGFGLSQAFRMTQAEVIGVVIQASCPGGIYSNIISYYLDGNINLSVVMTAVSTFFALGTLPLWLFIFPLVINIDNNCLRVPFDVLGYAILVIIAPLGLGLLFKYKLPEKSKIITKVCTGCGSLAVVGYAIVVLVVTDNSFLFDGFSWKTVVVAFLQLVIGFLFGYLATRVPWLSFSVAARRTVAIETALQNGALGTTIVLISFGLSSPVIGSILLFPLVYSGLQLFAGLATVVIYLLLKWKGKCRFLIPEKENQDIEKRESETEKQEINVMDAKLTIPINGMGQINTAFEQNENDSLTRL